MMSHKRKQFSLPYIVKIITSMLFFLPKVVWMKANKVNTQQGDYKNFKLLLFLPNNYNPTNKVNIVNIVVLGKVT